MAERNQNDDTNVFEPRGQQERSGGGQKGDEKDKQRQVTDWRGDTQQDSGQAVENANAEEPGNFPYDERELRPGGTSKQGDQQQMTQDDREARKDKSRNQGGSDKMHADEQID